MKGTNLQRLVDVFAGSDRRSKDGSEVVTYVFKLPDCQALGKILAGKCKNLKCMTDLTLEGWTLNPEGYPDSDCKSPLGLCLACTSPENRVMLLPPDR